MNPFLYEDSETKDLKNQRREAYSRHIHLHSLIGNIYKKNRLKEKVTHSAPLNKTYKTEKVDMAHQIKESLLHRKDINEWLRSRCKKFTQTDYLYKPDDIKRRIALKSVFNNFDHNHNGKLDLKQFVATFMKTYINRYYKVDVQKLDKYDL